jgi:two-component system sensor histidine kinase BaeS
MKIHNKLFLILFTFSLLLVTILILLMQWSIGKGMIDYVNSKEIEALKPVVTELENEYKKNNDWSTMRGEHKKFGDLLLSNLKGSAFMIAPPAPDQLRPLNQQYNELVPPLRPDRVELMNSGNELLRLSRQNREFRPNFREKINYALIDAQKKIVVGDYLQKNEYSETAIVVDKMNVGWLVVPKRKKIIEGYELDFIKQQQNYLWIIALVTMGLVALVTLLLARHIADPIKLLTRGVHKLTQGDYLQKIVLGRKDELGELSRDFNELAVTLHENESARKRWLANISHELRTPVAILRGELEAMLDSVRPLNKANIGSAHDEVTHLQHLIDDLQLLTSADIGGMHYRKNNNDLTLWLNKEVDKYRSYLAAAGINLVVDINQVQAIIFSDNTRLCQLFENIMNNCVKYAEADLVKISLTLDKGQMGDLVRVVVEDNGEGVAEDHLTHLFEYLYRVDNSRNRKTGGSGLGLSICAHIVTAHQGTIKAARSELGGLAIIIEFPLSH